MSGQLLKNTEDKSKQVIIALRGQLDEANDEKVFLFVCLFSNTTLLNVHTYS